MFGFIRRPQLRADGNAAAQSILRIAQSRWGLVWASMPCPDVNENVGDIHSLCYQTFMVDYFWQNVWRDALKPSEHLHYFEGISEALGADRLALLDSLYRFTEVLNKTWCNQPPALAYAVVLGNWYALAGSITIDRNDLPKEIGLVLLEDARTVRAGP